jgi:eukaryotic-like serine/threonine-protein kinase
VTLTPGTRLGPYEITAPIGAGGMGEVYRASDTRLQREVAIKVLPTAFSANAQLRARFDREARTISSINHPNICTLYDVGQQDGRDYLVMELIEGEPLSDRLARGPLPLADVLRYGIEIADALDKAHRRGIVHRDLKPGNVIVTRNGAKLLDFGLAKTMASSVVAVSPESPTVQASDRPLTAEGSIVGTFQYMAPEQVEGGEADARTDIFALGCVLYEMATGRRAFSGKSRASLIAQIMEVEPEPIAVAQPMAPRALDRVVRTCLAKNPDDRFQTAHDVVLGLRWIRDDVSQTEVAAPAARRPAARERIAWIVAAVAILGTLAAAYALRRRGGGNRETFTAAIVPPAGTQFVLTGDYGSSAVVSPDGSRLTFVAVDENGKRRLYVRSLATGDSRAVPGSENAIFPFWSADGASLGFCAGGKLKTWDLAAGGATVAIADAPDARGGAWNRNGVIVFASDTRGVISRVNADGSGLAAVTKLDATKHSSHRWPVFLPDGEHFVYLAINHADYDHPETALYVSSLDGKENRRLLRTLASAAVSAGQLLFLRESHLMAQALDGAALTGKPRMIADSVRVDPGTWLGVFSASEHVLLYGPGTKADSAELVTFSRDGKVASSMPIDATANLACSPDGTRLALSLSEPIGNIWIADLTRGRVPDSPSSGPSTSSRSGVPTAERSTTPRARSSSPSTGSRPTAAARARRSFPA